MSGGSGISGAGGGDQFMAMMRLLADPVSMQAEYSKLEQARANAQAVVDLVGPAEDVLRIRQEIERDRKLAADELAKAKVEVELMMSEAKDQAAQLVRAAQEEAAMIRADANATMNQANARLTVANTASSEAQAAQREVANNKAEADRSLASAKELLAQVNECRQQVDDRRHRLEKVVAGIAEQLSAV